MRSSYAHLNNNKEKLYTHTIEPVSQYKFIENPTKGFISNYGTHDWIAESALLVIKNSIEYYENTKILDWLLDPLDRIKWATLDAKVGVNQINAWFSTTQWSSTGLTNELWLKARRKAWFLHGTAFADKIGTGQVIQTYAKVGRYIPTEVFRLYHEPYFNKIGFHHVHVDGEGDLVLKEDKESGLALQAAKDAIKFLNKKHTLAQKSTGQTYEKYGSYEPGAFLIGMVAHFVSDLSSSPHTLPRDQFASGHTSFDPEWVRNAHKNWEVFTDNQMDPEFNVLLNGPTTNIVSREDLYLMAYDLTLGGKRPDIAARDLARYTRNALGDNFGHTLDYDPIFYRQHPNEATGSEKLIYEAVVKYTLKRSVLETANAILWILMQVDWDKHGNTDKYDTVGRLIGEFESVATEVIQHNPIPAAEIPNTMQGWTPFKPSTAGMTLSAGAVSMLVVLAPLIAIALIPITEKSLEHILKNIG